MYLMDRAVVQDRFEVRERIAGDHTLQRLLPDALLYGGPEVARDRAADDARLEDHARANWQRLDLDEAVTELPMTTGLALVAALSLCLRADRLAVRDARRAHVDLDRKSTRLNS